MQTIPHAATDNDTMARDSRPHAASVSFSGGIVLLGTSARRPRPPPSPSPDPPGGGPGSERPAGRSRPLRAPPVVPRKRRSPASRSRCSHRLHSQVSSSSPPRRPRSSRLGCLVCVGHRRGSSRACRSGQRLPRLAFLVVQPGNSVRRRRREPLRPRDVRPRGGRGRPSARPQPAARIALERSERRHRQLVEELPLVTYTARVFDSRVEYVSPQIERLLEITAEQALEEQDFWTARLHALDRDHVLREWHAWRADPSAEPFRRTYRMLTESGRVVWVDDVTSSSTTARTDSWGSGATCSTSASRGSSRSSSARRRSSRPSVGSPAVSRTTSTTSWA